MKRLLLMMVVVSMLLVPIAGASSSPDDISQNGKHPELNVLLHEIPPIKAVNLEATEAMDNRFRAYGQIPELKTGPEVHEWLNNLDQIRVNINKNKELSDYFYPNGPLIAYGTHSDGHVVVMLYKDYPNINEDDIAGMTKVIRNHAGKFGIKDVPIVFTLDDQITPAQGSWPALPSYSLVYRPITGGIAHSISNGTVGQLGTIGFSAERDSDNQKGYVIAGHVTFFESGLQSYQPMVSVANQSGTTSLVGTDTDVAFVPYDNVIGKLHVGGGYFIDVDGYYSGGITSMYLRRVGCVSGVELGDYRAVLTGVNLLGHYMDKIEVMDDACSEGDSGGPVYYTYYGRNKLVGTISAYGTFNGDDVTFYIPCSEITSKLDVTPLEA